jgi:hypothetical protein
MNIIASVVGAGSRLQHLEHMELESGASHRRDGRECIRLQSAHRHQPANSNKGDNANYYAPYQGFSTINVYSTRLWQEWNGLEAQIKHPVTNRSISPRLTPGRTTPPTPWSIRITSIGSTAIMD